MFVISSARKLIFRPADGAPVVGFPSDATINDYGVNNTTPTIVVYNATDGTWQGVDYYSGCVIVNEVPEEIALIALEIVRKGMECDYSDKYTYACRHAVALQMALYYLVVLGCTDQYTTDITFVQSKLSPAGLMIGSFDGIVKRDDRDRVACWKEGAVFYTAPSGKARVIQPDILVRTYRNPDGSEIDLDVVPEGRPEGVTV